MTYFSIQFIKLKNTDAKVNEFFMMAIGVKKPIDLKVFYNLEWITYTKIEYWVFIIEIPIFCWLF